jgi:hypothetical protein
MVAAELINQYLAQRVEEQVTVQTLSRVLTRTANSLISVHNNPNAPKEK